MKLRNLLASLSACAIAVSAMALSASAAEVKYNGGKIELSAAADDTKTWQYNLTELAGNGTLTQIKMDLTCPFAATGWAGGGGAVGMNFGTEWFQVDFAAAETSADNWSVTLDIPATYNDVAQDFSDGIIQIGWWWGAGDTLTIDSLTFVFEGGTTTDAPAADTDNGNTTTNSTGSNTGDAGIALAVAGLAVAGAAAYVARKKD